MTDSRDRIRTELAELIRDGDMIHMSESIKTNPAFAERVRKALASSESTKTGKAAKARQREGAPRPQRPLPSQAKLAERFSTESFGKSYQRWYSRALRVVEQLLPDRYDEFRELNRLDKRPKELDVTTYSISDYVHGTRVTRGWESAPVFDSAAVALIKFQNQIDILSSAEARLDSALADIEGMVEAILLDDEISTSRELLKAKHLRAAGVVAGVVLERHLKRLIANHQISFRKKAQISNLNDALKEARVYDVPQWRQIQRLGDIRNLCGHDADREPRQDEVDELISGVEKVSTTVF